MRHKLSDFQYNLPERLIAQEPARERTGSRLMAVDRRTGKIAHRRFEDLTEYLRIGDCMVFNDTRVMPARLTGWRLPGGSGAGLAAATAHADNAAGKARIDEAAQGIGAAPGHGKAEANGTAPGYGKAEASGAAPGHGKAETNGAAPGYGKAEVSGAAPGHGKAETSGAAPGHGKAEANGAAPDFGKAGVEALLIQRTDDPRVWEAMVKPGRRMKKGALLSFGGGALRAEVTEVLGSGNRLLRFSQSGGEFDRLLGAVGRIPLPPYIKNENVDAERYQTVYSKAPGSAAAPTAGLHFSEEYIAKLAEAGTELAYVTLHVGPGTFKPVRTENIEEHVMHSERFSIGENAAAAINRAKRALCVGTTSLRTLESAADGRGRVEALEGRTDIFIYPGYEFKRAGALLTNFHLPGSTLIMLVCAFAGYELAMEAYRQAVAEEYRFFSFGDAMLIM
jgi:S-adenosylmethionine:tRNA ribosyltransferase-isomerase